MIEWLVFEEVMGFYPIQEYGPYKSFAEAQALIDSCPDDGVNRWIEKVVPKPIIRQREGRVVYREF